MSPVSKGSRIKSRDTRPERVVRRLLYAMGYRFRVHGEYLPGTPDIVFASRRKVIFVHGCFWHGHGCRPASRDPVTNVEYWSAKIAGNAERDARQAAELADADWGSLVVWECELGRVPALARRLRQFLGDTTARASCRPV